MARTRHRCLISLIILSLLLPVQISYADEVISAENNEILKSGDFMNSEEWRISSSSGFSNNIAEYSVGMIADNELSITHNRPDNFAFYTAWAETSSTSSNNTLEAPDGSYTWSTGPEISMDGYDFSNYNNFIIESVSLVLHISIPNELNQDEVNVLLKNHNSDRLIRTFTNVDTSGGLNRMNNPVVILLDNELIWDWNKLEISELTIDYVSDNIGEDDSEVRVDAVGLRVKYHQPWYSFENVKAETTIIEEELPILEFGPYHGNFQGLIQSSCGLINGLQSEIGYWTIEGIVIPPGQSIGRLHSYGEGNFTISYKQNDDEYKGILSGELFPSELDELDLKITITDGCIEKIRIDINDPKLIINGYVSGKIEGLSNTSQVLFAIGDELVHTMPISLGSFSISANIGHALPAEGEFDVGIASRFQWASNGTQETSIVHITSISIEGGYNIEWDYDPNCLNLDNIEIDEDEGGLIIPVSTRCEDDYTPTDELFISGISMNEELVSVSSSSGDLRIQPKENSYGDAKINVNVIDARGNFWNDSFIIKINSIPDSPVLEGLPLSTYVNLGDTEILEMNIIDVDSPDLTISTSRSWAIVNEQRDLVLSPVQSGIHDVEITITDGLFEIKQSIEVIVEAKPDLIIESIEITESGKIIDIIIEGDIIEIITYVRNTGMGDTGIVTLQCTIGGILVGHSTIENISPGGMGVATCDAQINQIENELSIKVEVDSTLEIQETDENNNILIISIKVIERGESDGIDINKRAVASIIASIGLIIVSILALQLGPSKVKREFEQKK